MTHGEWLVRGPREREVGREEAVILAVLAVVAPLIGVPLLVTGIMVMIIGLCWHDCEAAGWASGFGLYLILLGSPPPLIVLAWAVLHRLRK